MGYAILDMVLRKLRETGFTAYGAYPGQRYPRITDTVATAHIEKVERDQLSVTIGVQVLCPAEMGGVECETQALAATEALRWLGGICVQNGCRYDGIAQVYGVEILVSFTGVTDGDSCTLWPGFYCFVGQVMLPYVTAFSAEESRQILPGYVMGEHETVSLADGQGLWQIQVEEQIPVGSEEAAENEGEFTLRLELTDRTETYSGCRWSSVKRELDARGIHRVRKGYALERTVS